MTKPVNHSFFSGWSEKMAWIFGFWAADGHVTMGKKKYPYIAFSQSERYIIEKIRDVVQSEHKIVTTKDGRRKPRYTLTYVSNAQYKDLCKLFGHDVQRKSLKMTFPIIPQPHLRHFIRGYVDGDGWVGKQGGRPSVQIYSGSKKFTRGLIFSVFEQTGILGNMYRGHKGTYSARYKGIKAKCLCWWLYDNISIALDRKQLLAKHFLKWLPRWIVQKSVTPKMKLVFPESLFETVQKG